MPSKIQVTARLAGASTFTARTNQKFAIRATIPLRGGLSAEPRLPLFATATLGGSSTFTARSRQNQTIEAALQIYGSLYARGPSRWSVSATLAVESDFRAHQNLIFAEAILAGEFKFRAVHGIVGKPVPTAPYVWPPLAPALPTRKRQMEQIGQIIDRFAPILLEAAVSAPGRDTAAVRRAVGNLIAYYDTYTSEGELANRLLACFSAATSVGTSIDGMERVLTVLLAEEGVLAGIPTAFVEAAILFVLAQEARILTTMTFVSRDDVDAMSGRMRRSFEAGRDMAADDMESGIYLKIVDLAASVTRYLADTGRPLPRLINVALAPMTALTISNRIYGTGERWNEIVKENRIVHPAFLPRELRVLSD